MSSTEHAENPSFQTTLTEYQVKISHIFAGYRVSFLLYLYLEWHDSFIGGKMNWSYLPIRLD